MYEYSCTYWWSEWDRRPYYNCLLKKDGKVILHIPNANKQISEKDMIGMWKARQKNGR